MRSHLMRVVFTATLAVLVGGIYLEPQTEAHQSNQNSPVALHAPWTAGQTWVANGSFWDQGGHCDYYNTATGGCADGPGTGIIHINDYYAVDWNKQGTSGDGDLGEDLLAPQAGTIEDKNDHFLSMNLDGDTSVKISFLHLASVIVNPGQHVTSGQKLGTVGNYQVSSSHIHMSVRRVIDGVTYSIKSGPLDGQAVNASGASVTSQNSPDTDGDGIPDSSDACPNAPEDFNGYQDVDGCPDADLDSEGLRGDFNGDGNSDLAHLFDADEAAIWFGSYTGTMYFQQMIPASSGYSVQQGQWKVGDFNGDRDSDGWLDGKDNCDLTRNRNQLNSDGDLLGDACDPDDDNDGCTDGQEIANQGIKKPDNPLDYKDFPDISRDGRVGLIDVIQLALIWNQLPGSPGWDADTNANGIADGVDRDMSRDGRIGLSDVIMLALAWNRICP